MATKDEFIGASALAVSLLALLGSRRFGDNSDTLATLNELLAGVQGTAGQVLAAPGNAAGPVILRLLTADHIPNLDATKITTGLMALARGGLGVDGSAIAANLMFGGPSSGGAGAASFRAMVNADLTGTPAHFRGWQDLTGAGAILPSASHCRWTASGIAQALTLANGTIDGQEIDVVWVAGAGGGFTGVLTPATATNFTSVTLGTIYDTIRLRWKNTVTTGWNIVARTGTTTVTP